MYFQIWISNNYAGGGHGFGGEYVIDKEVGKEMTKVVEEVNKKLVNEGLVVVRWKSLEVHMVTTNWRKAFCMWTMC